jgi:hypothetical protein
VKDAGHSVACHSEERSDEESLEFEGSLAALGMTAISGSLAAFGMTAV